MGAMASQITNLTIVCLTGYLGADQRKYQSSASLAFVWGIHRWLVNSPPKRASNKENVSIWWRYHELDFQRVKNQKLIATAYLTKFTSEVVQQTVSFNTGVVHTHTPVL